MILYIHDIQKAVYMKQAANVTIFIKEVMESVHWVRPKMSQQGKDGMENLYYSLRFPISRHWVSVYVSYHAVASTLQGEHFGYSL